MRAILIGGAATALCCGGPILIAALATTGAGAALAAFGWGIVGAAVVLVGVIAGTWWLVRGRGRLAFRSSRSATGTDTT